MAGIFLIFFLGVLAYNLAHGQDWSVYGHEPAYPWYKSYKTEMYRHQGYWRGFNDPVNAPRGIDTYRYRILRQMERDRIRKERNIGRDRQRTERRGNRSFIRKR